MRFPRLTVSVGFALLWSLVVAGSATANPPSHIAGAERTPDGGDAWATFKRVDVAQERSSRAVFVARNNERERTSGSPAAALSRSQASGRPDGCYFDTLSAVDGAVRVLQVCPGLGGLDGTAAEAFGISELRLTDPVTGEPLPTAPGSGGELIVVDPQVLAERAAAALDLPTPQIRMSPDGDQITQLPSWLWIARGQWQPRQVSASAGPVTSTVTARPTRAVWDMGNGDRVNCDGPGRPYARRFAGTPEATDCRYTYRHSSAGQPAEAYRMTVTVDWELSWTAAGAPGGGSLGAVPMSRTQPVRVAEVQALVQ